MKFILGTKQQMTQVFDEQGRVTPVTVINAGPLTVTQVRSEEKDRYAAVQVGFGSRKAKNASKALRGHLAKAGKNEDSFAVIREFKSNEPLEVGGTIDVSTFAEGDTVQVSGISKGKGFQGVVKRHGFAGGRRSHGQKHSEREPGSIGATANQRVLKGVRMAGRMGGERVTVIKLKVVKIDAANNQLYVSGAVPGRRGTVLEIIAK
ncbi:MAG TPA: 50S ribosomal protein L3 [Candidatus Paceibacterota bacterium]|nr:50S ribosomal protein L3 [Candidatus Paceibacterota bacterium]